MNIQQLKYAVEVARTGSITRAAENMFMSQPNLSKAIRELEKSIGFPIFRRTTRGMEMTDKGSVFLDRARGVLAQVSEMEQLYKSSDSSMQLFSISAPQATYIFSAFMAFSASADHTRGMEFHYEEAGTLDAVDNILRGRSGIAIVRYKVTKERDTLRYLDENDIAVSPISEFNYGVLMSSRHPLASDTTHNPDLLADYVQVLNANAAPIFRHGDEYYNADLSLRRRILLFTGGVPLELIENDPSTYMWTSPMPERILRDRQLVMRRFDLPDMRSKDVLIHAKAHILTDTELLFLRALKKSFSESV